MLPTRQWENCGNSEPSTSTMGDSYRRQSTSEDKNRGLGVAPKGGVDTGPQDRRNLKSRGLGVAPNGGVDAGPRDRRDLINKGLGVAPKEGVDTGPHDGKDIFNNNNF